MNVSTNPSIASRFRNERGMSLAEMLVASAVFLLVILAAYQVFQRSNEGYQQGQNQAEMVQNARVGFDQLVNDIRQAGYEFDVDGEITTYPNQADEPLEYMHFRALIVRANYDFDKELKGREEGLERNAVDVCCPVVTTANDEIVGYALGKPVGTTQPTGTVTAAFDTTGTMAAGDQSYRDAYVVKSGNTAGTIENEEDISVSGFELSTATLTNPPYTLYRFTFNEDGSVNKQPLIDNVRNLEFTYYNEADAVVVGRVDASTVTAGSQTNWGDDNGQDKEAGRLARWGIRRIKVTIQTMTPERDLRVLAGNAVSGADPDNYNGQRLFKLEEDIVPPNFGRRGQTDRDILPPEPVRNVEICTGQCGFVRVSWVPGPPEDKIADHIVVLCDGNCNDALTNRKGSFVVIANYDSTTDPDREYATFTYEDLDWLSDGHSIGARVIARNVAGTESECPVADCAECCKTQSAATIGSRTRLESFSNGGSTGYDPADASWPDALRDNTSGALVVTNSLSGYYPAQNQITINLDSPLYALNRMPGAASDPYDWTTKDLTSGNPSAALTCHREESTPNDATDDPAYRTKLENLSRDPQKGNTYVFRVSGSDSWNWGTGVTDPRNFVPGPDNLYDFAALSLTSGAVQYTDKAANSFAQTANRVDQYDDRFQATGQNNIAPSGGTRPITRPPQSLTPGEVYYYKFRCVDLCWSDKLSGQVYPNGVDDITSTRTAWMVQKDFGSANAYRQAAMTISPFYPPLLDQGNAAGDRDRADQSNNDSDNYPAGNNPIDAYAIPGYAIPATTNDGTAYIKPEKPTEFYVAKANDTVTDLISAGSVSKDDARLVFNSAKRTAPTETGVEPAAVTYTRYRLYRKRATEMNPDGPEMAFDKASATQLAEFRTGGQRALFNLTIDGAARGGPTAEPGNGSATLAALEDVGTMNYPADCPNGGENDGSQCYPWIYRLATVQCSNAALDDGIDTSTGEESDLSRPFIFPCQFYDLVEKVDLSPAVATGANSVSVTVTMHDPANAPDSACNGSDGDPNDTALRSARLLAFYASGDYAGDWIGSSEWQATPADNCAFSFGQTAIDKARREYTGSIRYAVELSDTVNSGAASDTNSVGCRVRSDLLGAGADFGVSVIGCSETCGDNAGAANVFRGTGGGDPQMTTEVLDTDPNTIRVTIPKVNACTADAFTLYSLEFAVVHVAGTPIPDFASAQITDGLVGGTRPLPDPSTAGNFGDGDVDESDLFGADGTMRMRWYQSFCTASGSCSYPKVRSGADPLIVDLTFEGPACDLKVTEFNFRVAVDFNNDATPDEMLCTRRGETGATADPQPPPGSGATNPGIGATGRGPLADPAEACVTCLDTCDPCYCPINNTDGDIAMDFDPDIELLTDPDDSGPGEKVTFTFTQQGCTADCDFALTNFVLDIGCGAGRTCQDINGDPVDPLPKLDEARATLVTSAGSLLLPIPDFKEESDFTVHNYKWSNLSGFEIIPGESFTIEVYFLGDMTNSTVTNANGNVGLRLDFGAPLEFECTPSGTGGTGPTSCNEASGSPIPIPN